MDSPSTPLLSPRPAAPSASPVPTPRAICCVAALLLCCSVIPPSPPPPPQPSTPKPAQTQTARASSPTPPAPPPATTRATGLTALRQTCASRATGQRFLRWPVLPLPPPP